MKHLATTAFALACLAVSSLAPTSGANATDSGDLSHVVRTLDSQLFDAFNRCASPAELDRHAAFFSPDTEFYHDNGGVTWTREAMIANTKKNACGNYTRALVETSFRVSPVNGFGAISTGTHRFCQTSTGSCDGEADFVMIWRNTDGKWEVTGTLSFAHRQAHGDTASVGTVDSAAIEKIRQEHGITSISVAVIDDGALVSAQAAGEARKGIRATPATYYNIASLAKPISAEVALQLVALGRISLDESMSAYWTDPDIAADPRRNLLTPRVALGHTTGFPNWRDGTLRFERGPGTAFGYSGEGFEYLARFIRKKTGQSIDAWADQLVFAPVGMRHTTYTRQAWLDGGMALPHDADGVELAPQVRQEAIASDDVFSTPSDYAQFMVGVMNGRALPPSLVAERFKPLADRTAEVCGTLAKTDCPADAGMSLGWESFRIDGTRYLMHTGSDDGTFTFAYFSPDSRTGMVIFTNSSNGAKAILPLLRLAGKHAAFVDLLQRMADVPRA